MSSRTWREWYTGNDFYRFTRTYSSAGHHTFREWLAGTLIETSRAVWFGAKRQPPGVSFELFQFKFLPKGNGSWWNCFRNCRFSHRSVTVSSKSPNELNHASTRLPLSRLGNNFLKESPQDGPYRSMQRNIPIKAFCWSPFIDAAQGCKCIAEVNFPSSCPISLWIKNARFLPYSAPLNRPKDSRLSCLCPTILPRCFLGASNGESIQPIPLSGALRQKHIFPIFFSSANLPPTPFLPKLRAEKKG